MEIQDDEAQLSPRGYMYRAYQRGDIYLHGVLSAKDGANEDTIQRLLLEFRQQGLISWDSVLDESRRTLYGFAEWSRPPTASRTWSDSYQRSIWADQPHRVELLSEKEALTPIVHRVTKAYQVPLSPCKGTPGGRSGSSPNASRHTSGRRGC